MTSVRNMTHLLRQQIASLTLSNYVLRITAATGVMSEAARSEMIDSAQDCHRSAQALEARLRPEENPPINRRLLLARAVRVARLRMRGEVEAATELERDVVGEAIRPAVAGTTSRASAPAGESRALAA